MSFSRHSRRQPSNLLQTTEGLFTAIQTKGSYLCVGLDPDPELIPAAFGEGVEGMEAFCKDIVSATHHVAVAYKPNLAFFEQYGAEGWAALERVVDSISSDVLVIADAKRGDIGNTATRYARAMFVGLGADAVTVAPYMGRDSVEPFTAFQDRWTILLALTSNQSAEDFEFHGTNPLFKEVLMQSQTFSGSERLMYVVGATRSSMLRDIREMVPNAFLLVPGVGAQGGNVSNVAKYGMNRHCGLLVNSSRGILYAAGPQASREEALLAAKKAAEELAAQMLETLEIGGIR